MDKSYVLPFCKKSDLGIVKNYRGITFTSIAAKIYNALLFDRIELKIEKFFRKNQNYFWRNRTTTSQILTPSIFRRSLCKKTSRRHLFVDFSKVFDSIRRGKIEQMLLAYGLPKENVAAIMMLSKNTKVKVHSPDGDTDFFDIIAGVQHGDTLA